MKRYTNKLTELRKEINIKTKEIVELNNQQEKAWDDLINEFNNNQALFRKMTGLSGLIEAESTNKVGQNLVVKFSSNSNPSATALSQIEDRTGLSFHHQIEDKYIFTLRK